MTFKRFLKYWIPVVLGMLFIYWMSTEVFSARSTSRFLEPMIRFFFPSITRKEFFMISGAVRKAAHVIEYMVLGILLFRAFRAGSEERRWLRWAASSLAVVVLYAMSDELHQLYVSARTASLKDVGFDALGGLLAQIISVAYYRRSGRKECIKNAP